MLTFIHEDALKHMNLCSVSSKILVLNIFKESILKINFKVKKKLA